MNRYYFAAAFSQKERMKEYREYLEYHGNRVTSQWIDSESEGLAAEEIPANMAKAANGAVTDMNDIINSDYVVVFSDVPSTTGGYYVEMGVAIALKKTLIIIGPVNNIFMTYAWIGHIFQNFEQFANALGHL